MTTDEAKYRAETFRVVGIAMLAPFGAVFLTPTLLIQQLGIGGFIVYIIISLISFIFGGMILEIGRRVIDRNKMEKKNLWEQMS